MLLKKMNKYVKVSHINTHACMLLSQLVTDLGREAGMIGHLPVVFVLSLWFVSVLCSYGLEGLLLSKLGVAVHLSGLQAK